MTIALGILAWDGLVIAADSEETWGGYLKASGAKISARNEWGALVITGAGQAGYIDAITQDLQRDFTNYPKESISQIQERFRKRLAGFWKAHVTPFSNPELEFQLIIGIERRGQRDLWVTDHTTIRSSDPYVAVGAGGPDALLILGAFFDPTITAPQKVTVDVAEAIAAHTVRVVKDRVPTCGKDTRIVRIVKGSAESTAEATLLLWERHYLQFARLQTLALQFVSGYPYDDATPAVERLMKYVLSLRHDSLHLPGAHLETTDWSLE